MKLGICIDNQGCSALTKDKMYRIVKDYNYYDVVNDDGMVDWFMKHRFKLIPDSKLSKVLYG